jgi:hypothetical protein
MPRWGWAAIAGLGAIVLVLATVLIVDSGNDNSETTTTSTSTTTSSTTSTTAAPGTTTPTTQPNTTCQANQLSANLTNPQAGAGQRYLTLVFTNTSSKDCTMFGFPGLQLLGPGNPPTNVVRSNKPKVLIGLQANGGQAFTTLHWGAIPGTGDSQMGNCQPEPNQIKLTSPNAFGSLQQPWTYGPVCEKGTIDVDPMAAGSGM